MREHKNWIIQNRNNNSTYNVVNTKFPSIRRPGDGVTEGDEYRMHPSCMEGIAKFMTVSFLCKYINHCYICTCIWDVYVYTTDDLYQHHQKAKHRLAT